ncbi:DMT family transporter [Candidatus Pacearchaeota archaeon]|nr:DMT family transporter [Candidatus Pacearchaeota archaeon]
MVFYFPILGAVALATGLVVQKTLLRKRKINIKLFQSAEFLAITLALLPFVYFFWKIDAQAFELGNTLIFSLVIILSIAANLFTYYSMKWEKLNNLEPAKLLEPLFIILLAIIFSYLVSETLFERNIKIIIPALIASAAIIFSHIKKHHLHFNKYFIAAILGSFFFALELIITRLILDFYSPTTFYFLRCTTIFLISFIAFKPDFSKLNKKVKLQIFALGFLWAFYRVIIYYGFLKLGVIFTTLMIMLSPIFIYLFAWKFLKEKLSWRNIVAALVIVGCVLYAILG